MAILKLLILILLPFPVVQAKKTCQTSVCRSNGYPIRFPFRLNDQPQDCGYPGFTLSCGIEGVTILNLPYSGSFSVRDIDYKNQKIELHDPNQCIQSRLFELNLSSTPFQAVQYRNYTFFICPAKEKSYDYIECLSNSTYHTIATSSEFEVIALSSTCKIIDTRSIAVPSQHEAMYSINLPDDYLLLKWNVPNCELCEANGLICGFKNSTSEEIHCLQGRVQDLAKILLRVIIIGIILPIVFCSSVRVCYKCTRNATQENLDQNNAPSQVYTTATSSTQRASHEAPGLDKSTIESFNLPL